MSLENKIPNPLSNNIWRQALALAYQATGLSDPNPRVGCVIVNPQGELIGQGHTQAAGSAHAEVMALQDAQARGADPSGATAYVTLEPCSHHGRTPPCADALMAAGVGRVVVAVQDPNPLVTGQGVARLRAAGIAVDVLDAASSEATAARELNIGFFSRMQRGTPWVRLKVAQSLDGRTALPNGASQWITGEAARVDGHAYRQRAGAILTGVGTVLQDNPRLDVRLVPTTLQPLRVICDSTLQTPLQARILPLPGTVLIYAAQHHPERHPERRAALQAAGAQVKQAANASGQVDLQAVVADLAQRGVNELHIEAGPRLNAAFIQQGLVDEFLIYLAPSLIGEGLPLAALGALSNLQQRHQLRFVSVTPVGDDLRIVARTTS
jgi:diaminohydroxyphosphoribosylaminopyrimidine deaminase / 5-amino-6-(5-phosphoribosylamino)uracil reductase